MTHLDHIEELRAELGDLFLTRRERRRLEAELAAALEARAAREREWAAELTPAE